MTRFLDWSHDYFLSLYVLQVTGCEQTYFFAPPCTSPMSHPLNRKTTQLYTSKEKKANVYLKVSPNILILLINKKINLCFENHIVALTHVNAFVYMWASFLHICLYVGQLSMWFSKT